MYIMNDLFFLIFLAVEANKLSSNFNKVFILRCLMEESFQPCQIFTDTNFSEVNATYSEKLANAYENLGSNFHNAVKAQNFSLISEEILFKIPDALLLLLPVNHLSKINGKYLTNLILQRSQTKAVKHLVKAYLLENKIGYLCEKLQTVELQSRSLKWITDVLGSSLHETQDFLTYVFFVYSPPSVLLNSKLDKLFYLILWEKSNFISKDINLSSLRIWSNAMFKYSFPESLDSWNDLYLERWGILLTALTADELILLKHSNINNYQLLFSLGFSTIQVRSLFDIFLDQLQTSRLDYNSKSYGLLQLLPTQLLKFNDLVHNVEQLKIFPQLNSLSTSKQIYELLIVKKTTNGSNFNSYINNFSYVLPLKNLSYYAKETLPSSLLEIQSKYFSRTQLYVLSTGKTLFDFNSESIFECTHFINVLPARDILFSQIPSHVLLHLVANIAADNIPQSFSVLNKMWSSIGFTTTFMKILSNPGYKTLLEYLPSRYIDQFSEPILKSIEKNIDNYSDFPNSFVSALFKSLKYSDENFNLLNLTKSRAFLLNGISCEEISSLDSYDVVIFMSMFNEQRKALGKDFPKKLQQCSVDKFLDYIQLKSNLFQTMLGDSMLSLLNEAEIDSIGGYIFSALPVKAVASAKYSHTIIKSIGELSLSELITAAPLSSLQELASVLMIENFKNEGGIGKILFDLGNLTFFLDKKSVSEINVSFAKLFLENNYYDHRLCVDKSSRAAWFNLLKHSFGETGVWTYQTLVTLGDILIVVPQKELFKIPLKSWIYAADVIMSHYHDRTSLPSELKFYEVCMLQLGPKEGELFFMELIKLTEAFVVAAQLQLDTVIPSYMLEKTDTDVFTNLDAGKLKIKFTIPTIRYLINTESPNVNYSTKGIQDTEENKVYFPSFHSEITYKGFSPAINFTFLNETTNYKENSYYVTPISSIQNSNVTDITNHDRDNSSKNLIGNNLLHTDIEFTSISKKMTKLYDVTPEFSAIHRTNNISSSTTVEKENYSSYITEPSFPSSSNNVFLFDLSLVNNKGSSLTNNYSVSLSTSKTHEKKENADFLDLKVFKNDVPPNSSQSSFILRELNNFYQSNRTNNLGTNLEVYKLQTLLNNSNSKTELLPLNSSFMNYKLNMTNTVTIGNSKNDRKKRSSQKWTCDALKIVGKLTEVLVTEDMIESMADEHLNECIDLFSEMDLSFPIKNLIWGKLNLEYIFLSGTLISALNFSELERINVSLSNSWALEIIHLIGRYSDNSKIKQHIIKKISKTSVKYSVELLVTLGSIICELPQISSQLIEPFEFFKASIILGKNLPCNLSCLYLLSNIAVEEGAFGDPAEWDAGDVSNLGIIISGLNFTLWRKLVNSKKNALSGMTESALNCLPSLHMKELVENKNFKTFLLGIWNPNQFNMSIDFEFFGPDVYIHPDLNGDRSSSTCLKDFNLGFILSMCNVTYLLCIYFFIPL